MTNITKSSLDTLPTPIPMPVHSELKRLTNRLRKLDEVGLHWEIDIAPSDDAKSALQSRSFRISNWMAPAGPENTLKELAKLFATMAIRAADDNERKIAVRVYVEDLMDLPLFALVGACKAFRSGSAGGGTWAPTQAEIRNEAVKTMAALVKERREIEAVLTATVRKEHSNSEHRAKVVAMALAGIKDMAKAGKDAEQARMSAENAARREEAEAERARKQAEQAALDMLIAAGKQDPRPLPKLSEELRRKFVGSEGMAAE